MIESRKGTRHIIYNSWTIRLPRLFHDAHILNCAVMSNSPEKDTWMYLPSRRPAI